MSVNDTPLTLRCCRRCSMTKCDKNKLSSLRQSLLNAKVPDPEDDRTSTSHEPHAERDMPPPATAVRHSLQGPPTLKTAVRAGLAALCVYVSRSVECILQSVAFPSAAV